MTHFYSTGDVAIKLSIPQYTLLYAIEQRAVADATLRVGGKRIFTDKDLKRLAEHFQVQIDCDDKAEQKKETTNEIQK
jgi:DNA-binding transcriptional MerR regulator